MTEKKYSFFVDEAETAVAQLGSGFIQSYLGTGLISKGFAVATQKRVYFKGKSFFKDYKGHWKKQMQEKTVDLKDITGTGFTSMRQLWILISAVAISVWPWITEIILRLSGFDGETDYAGMLWYTIIAAVISGSIYYFKRATLFSIEFAGGSISFNTSWYGQAEVQQFQKELRQAMAAVKDAEPASPTITVAAAPTPASASNAALDKVSALREYAKLKDEGIISEEEFQKMKQDLMG